MSTQQAVPKVSVDQFNPATIRKIGIYDTFTINIGTGDSPPHRIGERAQIGERVFFFGRSNLSAALAPGKMYQGPAPSANYLNCVAYAAAAKGAGSIQVTLAASAAANLFQGGYLHVNTGTTSWVVRIKDHKASGTVGTTANVVTLNLYDPIPAAITTSSYLTFTQSLWDRPIIVPSGGLTQVPCGVPMVTIPLSIGGSGGSLGLGVDYYGWLQTWGPCILLTQGTIVIANVVDIGGTADGACGPNAGTVATAIHWGQTMRVNATTTYSLVNLTLFP